VQEVAVASTVEIHCGNSRLELNDLASAVEFSVWAGYIDIQRHSEVSALMSLHLVRIYAQTGKRKPLLSLLLQFPTAKASEAKDKIYALLGLSNSTLVPDYVPSVTEVYKATAVHIILSTSNLDLLSFPRGDENRRNNYLPS
jgi:hypothetical protein